MARYTGPVCRLCRAEQKKLILKGDRCYSNKCAMERNPSPPGPGVKLRNKPTEYKIQLREKQRLRRTYGVMEKQFYKYVQNAMKTKGVSGTELLRTLERRLDNVIARACFANSRPEARQYLRHGHFSVNGRKVTIPSFQVKEGDVVEVREKSRKVAQIKKALGIASRREVPAWLAVEADQYRAKVVRMPERADIDPEIREQLIIEFYSR
jgi:small subunit ribosomal protein S4